MCRVGDIGLSIFISHLRRISPQNPHSYKEKKESVACVLGFISAVCLRVGKHINEDKEQKRTLKEHL
jgi:hypothetical protein